MSNAVAIVIAMGALQAVQAWALRSLDVFNTVRFLAWPTVMLVITVVMFPLTGTTPGGTFLACLTGCGVVLAGEGCKVVVNQRRRSHD